MSSTQRSRAIAALASLVTLLAVATVLSIVLIGNNGDAVATGTSAAPVTAVDREVDAADVRPAGSQTTVASVPAGGSQAASQASVPATVTTTVAGKRKTSTTVVKLPVAAAPAAGATSPAAQPATATSAKPAAGTPVTRPPASSTPTSVAAIQPKASVMWSTTAAMMPASTTTTAKPTTTTIATTGTTAATQPPPPATGGMTGVELEIARMTNELRTNPNGPLARKRAAPLCVQTDANAKVAAVPALTVNESVSVNMSRPWSIDMNSQNTMGHRPEASTTALYTQLGISPRAWGENVAWFQGYSDAQAAQVLFEGWRESDGHYCNMMSPSFTSFGVGVYKGSSRTWGTQNFYATR
ncbi:MAG: CAP domain-containing protein [Acidimicrobiia bacterium]|nr:CAP domain-containing protein [Acidimicrobiia bacterium]MDH5291040.1 CAP domain-containing protein [Acidimicrobiia bacterium]